MHWYPSHRADPRALPLANRHYSRQSPNARQFGQPARSVVLLTANADALWLTSWPYPEIAFHGRGDAWVCSLFRNEGPELASTLILEALAATRWKWGDPPQGGVITVVDPARVQPKRDYGRRSQTTSSRPGRCFYKAGFRDHPGGPTKDGKPTLWLPADEVPPAQAPLSVQLLLEAV
jgi:hypothetical protein